MDVLEKFLSGESKTQPGKAPATDYSSMITDDLLDRLKKTESGNDRFAVNKETKAMGPYQFLPDTVQMLHKKGIEFNPFSEKESREAAKSYLSQLLNQNKGDLKKSLAQYGGFVTKDPTAYVSKILEGSPPKKEQQIPVSSGDPLERFLSGQKLAVPADEQVAEPKKEGIKPRQTIEELQASFKQPKETFGEFVGKKVLGAGEAGLSALTGAVAVPAGAVAGIYETLTGGKYGTKEGIQQGQKRASEVQQALTYQPRLQTGQDILQTVGQAAEATKIPPVLVPEVAGFAPLAPAAKAQIQDQFARLKATPTLGVQAPVTPPSPVSNVNIPPTRRAELQAQMTAKPATMAPADVAAMQAQFEAKRNAPVAQQAAPMQPTPGTPSAPGMTSMGAAATTNDVILQEAINRASPQLASELKKIDPASLNQVALDNYLKADQFGIRLTKGQATGDPYLISMEQNERGLKKQLVDEFNQQNRMLTQKAEEIKQKAGEGTHEVNYVGNAERTMDAFKEINANSNKAISDAYKKLNDLGAGKIEVDSKTFGDNAMKALTANEDIDFLPSTIKSKIEAYQGGKPMNFAQYENLRTQISRETRKAQRADDGNAVHALTIARSELEKLPLLNETAEAKVVADKARSLAAQEFGLLDKRRPTYNQVYADIVNGAADTKDFIPKVVLRSKNADFAKAMDMLETKPDSLNQLRAGTLDYMIREATDASGNFKTAKFNDMVDSLDVNGKLTRLFGENSQQIKDLAHVGQLINARPAGQYVNTSNTQTAAAQLAKQYGLKLAQDIPVVRHLVEPAMQMRAERKLRQEVEETMRPGAGAGTKLKDMIKE